MSRFLIDANLPYRLPVWKGSHYVHVFDLNDEWTDGEIWRYTRENDLVIVRKDADFSDRIMLAEPPPRVMHLRIGNMKMKAFQGLVQRVWPKVCELAASHKLVIVHAYWIECVR